MEAVLKKFCKLIRVEKSYIPLLRRFIRYERYSSGSNKLRYHLSLALLFLFVFISLSHAQENRLVNTHSWQYEYINRLQQRGYLLELNPTDFPYAHREVREALEEVKVPELGTRERQWYDLLSQNFENLPDNIDGMRLGGVFEGGARHSSSARLNVIDPAGEGEILLPRGRVNGYLEWNRWIGQAGFTFDLFYDVDPVGLDVGRRIYSRGEETYLGYNGDRIDLYIGRFDNHWSLYDRKGGFLTDNPRSFDQIQFKFGTSKLSFSSILGEMDNMAEDGTFNGHSYDLGAYRRYLFLHRLDWSPVPNLKLSFIEGELYFSQTASISIRNLIPLHLLFFESHNAPMNNNSNLLIGGSIWYQTGPLTVYLQGMIDDFVVEDRKELQEENKFIPTTYTINSSITLAGLTEGMDIGLEADLVSANSYRSFRYQDQWTYLQRGLATNFSDYISTKLFATFYPGWLPGLKVEPAATLYLKGVGDMRELRTPTEPDGTQIPGILSGVNERTVRPSLYLRYQPVTSADLFDSSRNVHFNIWLDADMGINFVDNAGHQTGATSNEFVGLFRLFGQITF